jgi:hypothetical protein
MILRITNLKTKEFIDIKANRIKPIVNVLGKYINKYNPEFKISMKYIKGGDTNNKNEG